MTSSPWTQTVGVLAGTAIVATNLTVTAPRNILEEVTARPPNQSGTLFATAATERFDADLGIAYITREVAQARSRWFHYVARRLAELATGQSVSDMPAPSAVLCNEAFRVAEWLFDPDTPTPSVVPSEDGAVLFVWRSQPLELEIEIGPEEASVWAYERSRGIIWSGLLEEQRVRFSSLLDSFGSLQRSGPAVTSSP